MIRWLRNGIVSIFGISALFLLAGLSLDLFKLSRTSGWSSLVGWRQLVPFAILLLPGIVFAVAWWTNFARKTSGKAWGIAASIMNLCASLPLLYWLPPSQLAEVWLLPAFAITGLLVFLLGPPANEPSGKVVPPSVSGDGTSKLLNRVASLFGVISGLGVYWWWMYWAHANRVHVDRGLVSYAELLLVLFVVVITHELGHTLIGLGMEMKLRAFVAGPFECRFREGRWTFRFNPAGIFSPDGAVGVVPTTTEERTWSDLAMIAAGPAVNLFLGAMALVTALTAGSDDPIQMHGRMALFGAYSVTTGLVNLIPIRTQNNYSDGAKIFQILSGGPFADLHRAVSVVTSSLVTPLRPRDYDMQAIERASRGIRDGHSALLLRLFATSHFVDRGMVTEAGKALEEAEAIYHRSASDIPAELHTAFVFQNAYTKRDASSARDWWSRMEAKNPTRFNADYWLAHSAPHWIEGNVDAADESWWKGYELAKKLPNVGDYEFDRHLFQLLRDALNESIAQRTPEHIAIRTASSFA